MEFSQRIDLHKRFWNGQELSVIPVSFRFGDYFFADKFKAAKVLLKPGRIISPEMIQVDDFLEDYEMMYEQAENTGQTGFFTAEPYIGIPWIEAMLGCPVYASEKSFVTAPVEELKDIKLDRYDPWFQKYDEFIKKLNRISARRFPVGQSITRGVTDILGALMGQEQFVYSIFDEPEKTAVLAQKAKDVFLEIASLHNDPELEFSGGHSLGFYHVWAPGKCLWFQEDLSALLSPAIYRKFIKRPDAQISGKYGYSAVHLHPSSFHILDDLLEDKGLNAIEINKDIGGPGIEDMLPVFKKIIENDKCLIVWGTIEEKEIKLIKRELPQKRIFLSIVAHDRAKADKLLDAIFR